MTTSTVVSKPGVMTKAEWEKRIDADYDKIVILFSGGKDSLATLVYSLKHFDKEKITCLFADCMWDQPEVYAGIIYSAEKAGVSILSSQIPVDFIEIAKRMGNLNHSNLWCRRMGKYLALEHAAKHIDMSTAIAFEGVRQQESRTGTNQHWFRPKKKANGMDTYRPLLDLNDQQTCKMCLMNDFPLQGCYEYMSRSGCTCCPERTAVTWATNRLFYPNLFRKYLGFLEACSCDPHWLTYYAKSDLEVIFRSKSSVATFKRPITAGYTSQKAYDELLGIKMDDIRDDPNIQLKTLLEQCDVQPDIKFVKAPMDKKLTEIMSRPVGEPKLQLQKLFT